MDRAGLAKWAAAALFGALVLLAVWKWPEWQAQARAGSAYAARITCSCRFIEGRSSESCARDIADDAGMVRVREDAEERAVMASVPLLGSAKARLRPGFGCLMEPEARPLR